MNNFKYLILSDVNQDILDIRKEVFIDEQNVPIEIEYETNENEKTHCCLYLDNNLVAYGRIVISCMHTSDSPACKHTSDNVRVGRVCVRKEYRGLGYGKKIMNYIERIVKEYGFKNIEIHAQLHALDFYKSLGYQVMGKVFFEAGIAHVEMKKLIATK